MEKSGLLVGSKIAEKLVGAVNFLVSHFVTELEQKFNHDWDHRRFVTRRREVN